MSFPFSRSPRRGLIRVTAVLASCVVLLGAWVRLSNAGLSCPDWPGCYGQIIVPAASGHAKAAAHYGRPVEADKAWKEMGHRYLAGLLGLLILLIFLRAWRLREQRLAAAVLFVLVLLQAVLGMWTVTLLLKPLVVTLHLLGGLWTFGLLVWMGVSPVSSRRVRPAVGWGWFALGLLAVQLALGGWVSSHDAGMACGETFPICQQSWMPKMNLADAFPLSWAHVAARFAAQPGDVEIRTLIAIHWLHRLGALLVTLALALLAYQLLRAQHRLWAASLSLVLLLQLALGVLTVQQHLPLPLALAHNMGASLLWALLIAYLARAPRRRY